MTTRRNRSKENVVEEGVVKSPRRKVKEKFVEERKAAIEQKPLVPLNEKQKRYIRLIREKDMVIATGYAGTSKTYIPTVLACDWYRTGVIERIIFTRPNISNSKSLGYFGGDLISKMENWLMPVLNILRERLGHDVLEIAIKHGNIEFVPMELVKGYSAEMCVYIVEEAEDLSIDEAKKIVTRQGKNCKMILSGDISQSELKSKSGLKLLTDMVGKYPELNVGIVDFNDVEDIVRSTQCKEWIIAFNKEENNN